MGEGWSEDGGKGGRRMGEGWSEDGGGWSEDGGRVE